MRNPFLRLCVGISMLMCLSAVPGHAQGTAKVSRQVTGVVCASGTEEPLAGVSVYVKGSSTGTTTDANGHYSLKVTDGQRLTFACLGFVTTDVVVRKSVHDVSMMEDAQALDEVMVVGYGTMKRSDLTGSVASVSADQMKNSLNTSLDQALQGRAAGVQVTQNSGAPGGGISVSIRGVNSFNGNEPLYVIDGIPISGNSSGNTSALANINPSDIVSMEVLKDASATAIYGTRAANGVILITTKQGQAGATKITYEGYYAFQQLPNELDVLDLREYATYQNLRAEVIGFGAREEFADPSVLGKGTNWQKEIFRNAPMWNHQLTISGGSDRTKFAIMAGYMTQDGIAIGSNFERYSLRFNADTQIKKWLKVGLNSYIARRKQTNTIDNGDIIATAVRQIPETPVKNSDGSWGTQPENMYGTYFSNPVAEALSRENYNRGTDIQVRGYFDIAPVKGLTLRAEVSTNINYNTSYQYTPLMKMGYFNQDSSGSRSSGNSSYLTFTTYATYERTFGKHNFSVMIGHESQEGKNESLSGSRKNYIFNSVHELGVGDADTAKNDSSRGESGMESYYGRVNYNFADRYLLTATVRRDGSSKFSEKNRWATFPSVALAWKLSNEKFMKGARAIDNLKFRVGWGMVGNQSIWNDYAYGVTMSSTATPSGQGFFPGNFSNPELKWEKTNSYNLGLDVSLLGNRIELIADIYKKDIKNLLMQAALPSYVSGVISSPWVNAGEMTNKGVEITLNTVNISTKDFSWRTGITFSRNTNEVTRLYSESSALIGSINGLPYTYTMVGKPVGQLYGYKVIGMFKEEADFYQRDAAGKFLLDEIGERIPVARPKQQDSGNPKEIGVNGVWVGDYIFKDKDGNGVIDEQDRYYIGNPDPKFTLGFNNSFAYKGFDLNIFINAVYGNKIYNMLREKYTNPMSNSGLLKEATKIAVVGLIDPDGPSNDISNVRVVNSDAEVQRINTTDANDNNRMSDRFVEDGSYLRIKNVSLGYTFPRSWMSRFKIENLRVYMNIQNLYTFTNYSGYDPEVGSYDVLLRNIDNARYPSQRMYTFGLNLTF